jgi:hypothetical protein
MTKNEAKESLVSALRDQGIDYYEEGDVVDFEDLSVRFETQYINVRYGSVSVHYLLSKLSYIAVMGGAFWISTIDAYEFTTIYFSQTRTPMFSTRIMENNLIDESEDEDKAVMDELEDLRLLAGFDD